MQHDFTTSSWALYQVIGGITGYFSQPESGSSGSPSSSSKLGQQRQHQATSASSVGVEDTLGMFISWSIERDADRVFPHLSRPIHIDPLERLSSFVQRHRVLGSISILGDVFTLVSLVGTMVAQSEASKEVRSGAMSGLVEWSSMFDSTALGLLEDLHPDHTYPRLRNQLTSLGDADGLEGPAEGEEVDNLTEKVDADYLTHQSSREMFLLAVVAAQLSCLVEKDSHQPFISAMRATPLDAITQRSHELYEVLELRADGVVEKALFEGAIRSGYVSQAMELYWGRMGSAHQKSCSTHILPVIITTVIHAIDTQLSAVREAKGAKNQTFARLSALSVELTSALGKDCIRWADASVSGGGDASGLCDDMRPWLAASWECYLSTLIPGSSAHCRADKDVFTGMKAFLSCLPAFATAAAASRGMIGQRTPSNSDAILSHLPEGVKGLVRLLQP